MYTFFDRDISWLSFNERVLQEAESVQVPLIERLRFLAIFSSNLDEFYRVRVASRRQLGNLKKKTKIKLNINDYHVVDEIYDKVNRIQSRFGKVFREIISALRVEGISLIQSYNELTPAGIEFIAQQFETEIKDKLVVHSLESDKEVKPFLENKALYFVVVDGGKHSLVNIPTKELKRFYVLPSDKHEVIMLDDIIRFSLSKWLGRKVKAYEVKLSRDADLHLEDEFKGDVVAKIKKSLNKRDVGVPSRFLFDKTMPETSLKFLKELFELGDEDLIRGGTFHNTDDFFGFPFPNDPSLCYQALPALKHHAFETGKSMLSIIRAQDQMCYYPYHKFNYLIDLVNEAVDDPDVEEIKLSIYRVAKQSEIVKALLRACDKGIKVTVFDEVQARFDEQLNLYWGGELEKKGARVLYSREGIKVHAKLLSVKSKSGDLAYISTGNFNENTANIYTDIALMTARKELCDEVEAVFQLLEDPEKTYNFMHLLVAPAQMRKKLIVAIRREVANAEASKEAYIFIKLNNLEDKKMIKELYKASNAGVKIELMIRGICCLIPGVANMSENISVRSIVDRFLEHSRIYYFANDGNADYYISSADLMKRNLSRRIEVAVPIYEDCIRKEIDELRRLQWSDTVKGRIIDEGLTNKFVESTTAETLSSQEKTYLRLKQQADTN